MERIEYFVETKAYWQLVELISNSFFACSVIELINRARR